MNELEPVMDKWSESIHLIVQASFLLLLSRGML